MSFPSRPFGRGGHPDAHGSTSTNDRGSLPRQARMADRRRRSGDGALGLGGAAARASRCAAPQRPLAGHTLRRSRGGLIVKGFEDDRERGVIAPWAEVTPARLTDLQDAVNLPEHAPQRYRLPEGQPDVDAALAVVRHPEKPELRLLAKLLDKVDDLPHRSVLLYV